MKNYKTFSLEIVRKASMLIVILSLFQIVPSKAKSILDDKNPGKELLAVYVDGKMINLANDSIEVATKGILSLGNLTQKKEILSFRVVIRHNTYVQNLPFLLTTLDERYNDGEVFKSIEIEKILHKAKPGDEIIIVPVDENSTYENSRKPFRLNVVGGGC